MKRGAAVNPIVSKSKDFAVRIIRLYQYLQEEKQEMILSKQILRSGTSIGANVREGTQAASRPDFINKLTIALKESVETEYWLELLAETDYISQQQFHSLYSDNKELTKLLTAIIKTTKTIDNCQLSIVNSLLMAFLPFVPTIKFRTIR